MTVTERNRAAAMPPAESDLTNLAGSITEAGQADPRPGVPITKGRPQNPPQPAARPECRPVAAGGMFATLHPECSQDYVDRFQQLRTHVMLHRMRVAPTEFCSLAVMSTRRGEGKSFTATNLASTLAAGSGQGVLLIDGNPEGAELPLGVDVLKGGLTQALIEPEKWSKSVYAVKDSSLSLMPRGRVTGRSIDFSNLPRLFAQLRRHFEWVVFDGTSFSTSPDADWFASVADGTLVVTQGGSVKFGAFQDTLMRVPEGRMVGVVFNQRPRSASTFRVRLRFSGKWLPGEQAPAAG